MNDGNRVFVGFFTLKKPAISPYNLLNRVSGVIQKEGVGIHQRTIRQQRIPHNKRMKRLGVGKQVINNSIRKQGRHGERSAIIKKDQFNAYCITVSSQKQTQSHAGQGCSFLPKTNDSASFRPSARCAPLSGMTMHR
jgi:hypothetical protein